MRIAYFFLSSLTPYPYVYTGKVANLRSCIRGKVDSLEIRVSKISSCLLSF